VAKQGESWYCAILGRNNERRTNNARLPLRDCGRRESKIGCISAFVVVINIKLQQEEGIILA
jgi:hypothetical protein